MNLQTSTIKVIPRHITTKDGRTVLAYFVIAEINGELRVKIVFNDPRVQTDGHRDQIPQLKGSCISPLSLCGSVATKSKTFKSPFFTQQDFNLHSEDFLTVQKARAPSCI